MAIPKLNSTQVKRNLRGFNIRYITSDEDISVISISSDGSKTINTVEGTNSVDFTVRDLIADIGDSFIVDNDGTGVVRIIADSTETFIGEGNTGENFTSGENTITVPTNSRVVLLKKKVNTWRVDGVYTTTTTTLGDAWNISGVQFYINNTSIDSGATSEGDPVTIWTDLSTNTYNITNTGTPSPELHLRSSDSQRQVTFDGANDYLAAANSTILEYNPQVDTMSIAVLLGETVSGAQSFGYVLSKASTTPADRTYALNINNNDYNVYAGGTNTLVGGNPSGGDLIIMTFSASATGLNIYVNGTQLVTNGDIGTGQDTSAIFNLGSRTSGSSLFAGDISKVAIYNKVLSTGEISAIETQEGY